MRIPLTVHKNLLSALVVLGVLPGISQTCLAQGAPPTETGIGVTLSLTAVRQFTADMGDSRFDVSRTLVKVDKDVVQSRKVIANLGFTFGISDYSFSGPPADPWSDPFGSTRSVGADVSLLFPAAGNRVYFLAGTLDWSWEDEARMSEALVHGVIASVSWAKGPHRRLGFGAAAFRGLEETKFFPYVAVSWKLRDRLSLSNPLPVGPAGPAGLELVYDATETWQFGTGAAWRSFRYRLDDEGLAPGGIGEVTGVPTWVRASWRAGRKVRVDLYAGGVLAGEATIESGRGRELESTHYDAAPLAAVTLEVSL